MVPSRVLEEQLIDQVIETEITKKIKMWKQKKNIIFSHFLEAVEI